MAPITECVLLVAPASRSHRDAGATKPLRDSPVRPRGIFHMSSRKGAATWS